MNERYTYRMLNHLEIEKDKNSKSPMVGSVKICLTKYENLFNSYI